MDNRPALSQLYDTATKLNTKGSITEGGARGRPPCRIDQSHLDVHYREIERSSVQGGPGQMTYNIRPLSFVEILDSAFSIFRDNFVLLAGISAVVLLPVELIMAAGFGGHPGLSIVGVLLTLIFEPVMAVAFTTAVASVYLDRPVTIADAYRSVGKVFTPVIGTLLLMDILLFLGALALIVPAIYFAICWSLVFPVMIVEHRFGMTGLRRSRQLVSGVWWKTLGVLLVALLIARVPALVLNMIWSFIPVLGSLLTATTTSIAAAYSLVVVVTYYFDRRCRIEDFDLRLLAEQIRAEGATEASPTPQPSAAD
jgi:hypothetical protein